MKLLLVIALFVLTVAKADDQLKCFTCIGCKNSVGNPKTCGPDDDVCIKVESDELVVKHCGSKDSCGLGKLERATNRLWTDIKNVFKDVDESAINTYCCDDDLCNSGFKNIPSFAVIFLPLILVALFKY